MIIMRALHIITRCVYRWIKDRFFDTASAASFYRSCTFHGITTFRRFLHCGTYW